MSNLEYFQNEILNDKIKDKIQEMLPDSMQQNIFISSLYDIAINEYVKTGDINVKLKEHEQKINFTIFKTLEDLKK